MEVTNLEQLFIRACKRSQPKKRLVSVLRRFYLGDSFTLTPHEERALILHLSDIVDKCVPMTVYETICEMDGNTFFKDDRPYRQRALDMLISRIALSKKDKFVGMRTPAWIKNKYRRGGL